MNAIANLSARQKTGKMPGTLTLKISTKGAVSVYGLGRFPITLYSGQWMQLLEKTEDIRAFINANADKLISKEEKAAYSGTNQGGHLAHAFPWRTNMAKVFRIQKSQIIKICRKSIVLVSKRRIKCKRVIEDFQFLIIVR